MVKISWSGRREKTTKKGASDEEDITDWERCQGVRRARVKEICELPLNTLDVDMKTELIQALIPIGLWHVEEVLEQEVRQ